MKNATALFLVPLLPLAMSGCSGGGGGGGAVACTGNALSASEANDYSFSSTLTFPPVAVAPKTDLTFDWTDVTKDFLGHALDTKKDLNTILARLLPGGAK